MQYQEWIKPLADGRMVKFTWEELREGVGFVTAQLEVNPVVYSVMLTKENTPFSREEVEIHFAAELGKK